MQWILDKTYYILVRLILNPCVLLEWVDNFDWSRNMDFFFSVQMYNSIAFPISFIFFLPSFELTKIAWEATLLGEGGRW